jgi:hypothetical protein
MSAPEPKLIIDTAIATGMVTTPIWLQWVEQSLQLFMLIGGSILLIARLWSIFIRKKGKEDNE